jgi:hypothetical protein
MQQLLRPKTTKSSAMPMPCRAHTAPEEDKPAQSLVNAWMEEERSWS